jgi:hypothetical protein
MRRRFDSRRRKVHLVFNNGYKGGGMKKWLMYWLAGFALTIHAAEQVSPVKAESAKETKKVEAVSPQGGATWDESGASNQGATWDESNGPVYYLYPPYNNKGEFVRTPAKIFGAIGIVPGSVIGAIVALPLLPWQSFPTTIHSSNTFFGQGFSMIFGTPFYVLKIIFWDVPSSWGD